MPLQFVVSIGIVSVAKISYISVIIYIVTMSEFTKEEQADIHLTYGLADGDPYEARQLYECCYQKKKYPSISTIVSYHRNLQVSGKFTSKYVAPITLNMTIPNYECSEKTDIHYMYGHANQDANLARQMYGQRYPERQLPEKEIFSLMDKLLREYGGFHPIISDTHSIDAMLRNSNTSSTDNIPGTSGLPNNQNLLEAEHNFDADESDRTIKCPRYTFDEMTDMHLMYGLANGNACKAITLYRNDYSTKQRPAEFTFIRYNKHLKEDGKFLKKTHIAFIKIDLTIPNYECWEKTDMHYIYGLANRDADRAREMYGQIYPDRQLPEKEVFSLMDKLLRDYGGFHPIRCISDTPSTGDRTFATSIYNTHNIASTNNAPSNQNFWNISYVDEAGIDNVPSIGNTLNHNTFDVGNNFNLDVAYTEYN